MNRRTFLKTVGVNAGAVALSGCTQVSQAIPGCSGMQSTDIDLEATTLSDEQTSHLLPLVYDDLRVEHQHLVERASGESRVKACPPIPKSVQSFVDLVRDRIDWQWAKYDGKPEDRPEYLRTAYLKRHESYSVLQVVVEDVGISE